MPPVPHPISPPPGCPPPTSPVLLSPRRHQLHAHGTAPADHHDHLDCRVQDIRVTRSQHSNTDNEPFWTDLADVPEDLWATAKEGVDVLRADSGDIINRFFPGSQTIHSAAIKPRFAPLRRDSWIPECNPGPPNCTRTRGYRRLIIVGAVGGYMIFNSFAAHTIQGEFREHPYRWLYTFVAFVAGAPIFLVAVVAAKTATGGYHIQGWYRVRQEARANRREAARREAEAAERATDGIELIPIHEPPPAYLASFLDRVVLEAQPEHAATLAHHAPGPQEAPPAYHRP